MMRVVLRRKNTFRLDPDVDRIMFDIMPISYAGFQRDEGNYYWFNLRA